MFEIEYKGANCVIISTKKAKIIVDPKLSLVGLKDISTRGSVELVTEDRFAVNDSSAELVINSPGDFGVADFDIHGIPARRSLDGEGFASTIYSVVIDGSKIGIIGNIHDKLSDEQLEELGVLDVLIIPVGGNGYTLDAAGAAAIVRMIGPKAIIPVHYADKLLKYEVPQDELGTFTNELGAPVETVQKYKSKQSPIIGSPMTVFELTRS